MYLHMNTTEQVKNRKKKILITTYTPHDTEHMRTSSNHPSPSQERAIATVNRTWRIIDVLLYIPVNTLYKYNYK